MRCNTRRTKFCTIGSYTRPIFKLTLHTFTEATEINFDAILDAIGGLFNRRTKFGLISIEPHPASKNERKVVDNKIKNHVATRVSCHAPHQYRNCINFASPGFFCVRNLCDLVCSDTAADYICRNSRRGADVSKQLLLL